MKDRTYVSKSGDMPHEEHFAVLEYSSIYIPGDQRSRDAPGHGYPASTENIVRYIAFGSKVLFEEYVEKAEDRQTYYTPIFVKPVTIEKKLTITVK